MTWHGMAFFDGFVQYSTFDSTQQHLHLINTSFYLISSNPVTSYKISSCLITSHHDTKLSRCCHAATCHIVVDKSQCKHLGAILHIISRHVISSHAKPDHAANLSTNNLDGSPYRTIKRSVTYNIFKNSEYAR